MTVEALRRGRPEVLADLLARYGRDMQAVAYLIVRDRSAAEDVVADSLLAALDHGHGLRDEAALRPWLLRIATNKALRHRQRAARIVELEVVDDLAAEDRGPAPTIRWRSGKPSTTCHRGCARRSGLRYYLDMPVETVAEILDVSPNTIKIAAEDGARAPAGFAGGRTCTRRGGATCVSLTTPPWNANSAVS